MQHSKTNKSTKSIEETIEFLIKKELDNLNISHFSKTDEINTEIDYALNNYGSKNSGEGKGFPDIKLLLKTNQTSNSSKYIPVMIEVKGKQNAFIKYNKDKEIDNSNFKNIKNYAVNGAIHYADVITLNTHSYNECIAIGYNGYKEDDTQTKIEFDVYLVSAPNIYKKLGNQNTFHNKLDFLTNNNNSLNELLKNANLTPEEIEDNTRKIESQIENNLKLLNETIHNTYGVAVQHRVEIIVGMIISALGIADKEVFPLEVSQLRSENSNNNNDGKIFMHKISDFLENKNLSKAKIEMITNELEKVFIHTKLWQPENGESKLKKIYIDVLEYVMPYLRSNKYHLDFTGQLFNVLNRYVDVPDGEQNDVVLTPRYVTDLMARLCKVNKDSYVWDFALGSAGFLISALKLMINDAEQNLSGSELENKLFKIKSEQLLGVELRPDICLLAILNMILVGDGSSNILNENSLTKFDGKYQGKNTKFPANVFLLNPPYSQAGKGFIFVQKALSKMQSGYAAVLIQENAGSGNGLPYTKKILETNKLLASIKMSDIFCGKASVQTAIYLFEVGTKHNQDDIVKFIDFSNDGYARQNRKKSNANVNLKNVDFAIERYNEIVAIVLNRQKQTDFYNTNNGLYFEDTITLNGDDWTFSQHKKIDTMPTFDDFQKSVSDYLSWKISDIIKNTDFPRNFITTDYKNIDLTEQEKSALLLFKNPKNNNEISWKSFMLNEIFCISGSKTTPKNELERMGIGNYPYVTTQATNNGIAGYYSCATENGNCLTIDSAVLGTCFYQENEFSASDHVEVLRPKNFLLNKKIALFFVCLLNKTGNILEYSYGKKRSQKALKNESIFLPITNDGNINFELMQNLISAIEKIIVNNLIQKLNNNN